MKFSFLSKQFLCSLLIILFIIPTAFLMQPKPVHATGTPVFDASNFVQNTTSAISTAGTWVSTKLLEVKAFVLDGLAFAVVNTLIEMLTRDILNWINTGFKGNPAFITNPEQFFMDVGDQVTGQFLQGSDLAMLCSPFALQVKIALAQYRGRTGRYQCTLSRIVNNSQNFLNGISSADSWNNWLQISSNPANNPYGAFMMANDELSVRIANKTLTQSKLLDWGRGFFSVSDPSCTKKNASDQKAFSTDPNNFSVPDSDTNCPKVTPGAAIEYQLNANLDSGRQRLVIATSFNQIVSALLTQLAKQAITGAFGLLGLSQKTYSGGSSYTSYLSQLGQQSMSASTAQSIGQGALSDITSALTAESGINSARGAILGQLQGTQSNLQSLVACYQKSSTGAVDSPQLSTAKTTLTSISTRIITAATAKVNSDNLIGTLSTLQTSLQTADSTSAEYQNALLTYQSLRQNTTFHTQSDLLITKNEQASVQDEMTTLNSTTINQLQQCNGVSTNTTTTTQ